MFCCVSLLSAGAFINYGTILLPSGTCNSLKLQEGAQLTNYGLIKIDCGYLELLGGILDNNGTLAINIPTVNAFL